MFKINFTWSLKTSPFPSQGYIPAIPGHLFPAIPGHFFPAITGDTFSKQRPLRFCTIVEWSYRCSQSSQWFAPGDYSKWLFQAIIPSDYSRWLFEVFVPREFSIDYTQIVEWSYFEYQNPFQWLFCPTSFARLWEDGTSQASRCHFSRTGSQFQPNFNGWRSCWSIR